ncbi:MAG: hypothetical protein HC846_09520 [Blastocatellia bacterium]|nr:hypothetical protein [Blastocatellia bacterium]
MYDEITILSQAITLFNERKPEEVYGTIDVKYVFVIDGLNTYFRNIWHWTSGIYQMEGGGWKFENALAANKLWRVMNLNSFFSEIQIVNHTRWKHTTVPTYPWFAEGDNSGGTASLSSGARTVDFRVRLKK